MGKRVLITGINGMDGSHLADLLLSKGYDVYGMERDTLEENRVNTSHLIDKITFLKGDLLDSNSLLRCVQESQLVYWSITCKVHAACPPRKNPNQR